MILLPPKFSENFEADKCSTESTIDQDCFNMTFSNNDGTKLKYVEVFSPTVFETVEVYSSSLDQPTNNADFIENAVLTSENNTSTSSPNLNLDLENLEPGTYTLDVLEASDFNFDIVFADPKSKIDGPEIQPMSATEKSQSHGQNSNIGGSKKPKTNDDTAPELFKLRNRKNNSSRKSPSPKYSPRTPVNAREFVNNFSNDLQRNEEKIEEKSLSWLLDFKVSSIFHSVETEADNIEKTSKRRLNDTQKKPRYTYTELIEQALKENGELTVSGIYNWISNHYPYYQQHDDRWKNSVRHNLSINPQFRKGKKASQGAGHFWNISDTIVQNSEISTNRMNNTSNFLPRLNIEQPRYERVETDIPDSVTELMSRIDEEVLAATKSIQESENLSFIDVSLQEAAVQQHHQENNTQISYINTTRDDIEQLWESTTENSDQRYGSFSPLIRELTEESGSIDEENFLIEDIHNSICLGDEFFTGGLSSPYYNLTTI